MKTLITAIALTVAATSASAYTCKNTVTMVDGEWIYTSSQCGNQAPASADTLAMITYIANNPPKDNVEDVVAVATVDVPLTKLEKLNIRLDNLKSRNNKYMDRLVKIATRFDGSNPQKAAKKFNKSVKLRVANKTWKANNTQNQAKNLANFNNWSTNARINGSTIYSNMMDNRVKVNKVNARINKLSGSK